MKLRAVAVFLLLVFSSSALADNDRRDGSWWVTQDKNAKLNYMTGFFDGMQLGHNFSYWKYVHSKNAADAAVAQKTETSFNEFRDKYLSSVTNNQLVNGLDKFYSDEENRRILIKFAVWLVLRSIAGMPQDEWNKMVAAWRSNVIFD